MKTTLGSTVHEGVGLIVTVDSLAMQRLLQVAATNNCRMVGSPDADLAVISSMRLRSDLRGRYSLQFREVTRQNQQFVLLDSVKNLAQFSDRASSTLGERGSKIVAPSTP